MPEERLELIAKVEDEYYDPLERLEGSLEDVDNEIAETGGGGSDKIKIDAEAQTADAIHDLALLDQAIEGIDDEVTIDVDVDDSDLLREDVETSDAFRRESGSGTPFVEFTGRGDERRPVSTEDALDPRFEQLNKQLERTFSEIQIDDLDEPVLEDISDDDVTVDDSPFEAFDTLNASIDDATLIAKDLDVSDIGLDRATDDDSDLFDDFDEAEQQSAARFIGPAQFQKNRDPFSADGSTGGAVADGDSGRGGVFSIRDIDSLEATFGDDLDVDELVRRGGEVGRVEQVIEGDLIDKVDLDEFIDLAVSDDDTEFNLDDVMDFTTGGHDDVSDLLPRMRRAGLTDIGDEPDSDFRKQWNKGARRLNITMGKLHQAMASVVPLLGIFVGALPAAITGVVALGAAAVGAAGALAGIAGLGLLGISQQDGVSIDEEINKIIESFREAFSPLANTFAPVVLESLEEIEEMAEPLADASSGLVQFRDEFSGLVEYATGAIPSFTREMIAFTDAAMPIFEGFKSFLSNTDFLGFLAGHLAEALPMLVLFGKFTGDLIAGLINLSHGFLIVATTVMGLLWPFAQLLNAFPTAAKLLGVFIGVLLFAATAVTLLNTSIFGTIALVSKWIVILAVTAVKALISYTYSVIQSAAATYGFAGALATVLAMTVVGIGAVAMLAAVFAQVQQQVEGATQSLKKFANTKGKLRGISGPNNMGLGSGETGIYEDNSKTVIYSNGQHDAARQQYSSQYEKQQHRDSVFGN